MFLLRMFLDVPGCSHLVLYRNHLISLVSECQASHIYLRLHPHWLDTISLYVLLVGCHLLSLSIHTQHLTDAGAVLALIILACPGSHNSSVVQQSK